MSDILILDDDFALASSWRGALEAEGHSVVLSSSSEEAFQHFQQRRFQTVIVDLMLAVPLGAPPDSGIHFLRELKNWEPLPKLIGVSGYMGSDDGEMTKKLMQVYGVKNVLMKPFETEDLVALVE